MATSTARLEACLGRRCEKLRLEAGLSQMGLVRYHDFSLSHYQKIERGDLDPRLSTLKRLAESLGVKLGELVDGL